jgi:hypothetical protein
MFSFDRGMRARLERRRARGHALYAERYDAQRESRRSLSFPMWDTERDYGTDQEEESAAMVRLRQEATARALQREAREFGMTVPAYCERQAAGKPHHAPAHCHCAATAKHNATAVGLANATAAANASGSGSGGGGGGRTGSGPGAPSHASHEEEEDEDEDDEDGGHDQTARGGHCPCAHAAHSRDPLAGCRPASEQTAPEPRPQPTAEQRELDDRQRLHCVVQAGGDARVFASCVPLSSGADADVRL